MTDLERAAMASDVLSSERVEKVYGYATQGSSVRMLCLSHERLRMELENAMRTIAEMEKDLHYWQNKDEIIRSWLENEPTEEQSQ